MENKRQKQVAKLIQKELGEIFLRDFKTTFDGAFVTITDVKMTPDLGIARVYLSFLLTNDKESILQLIKENTKKIRSIFGDKVRHQFRVIPSFQFYIDDTAEYAQKIEKLFADLYIPPLDEAEIEE